MTQINATYHNVTAWLQSVFFYHYTYYQILVVTEQWGLFTATIAGIVVQNLLLNEIMKTARTSWTVALNKKDPLLKSIGMRYLRIFAIITALEMFFRYVQTFFNKVIAKTLQTKVAEKLGNKHEFRAIKESEQTVNDNPKQSGLAKVLSVEAEWFIDYFVWLHKDTFSILFWMTTCALDLYQFGLLYEVAKVFAICVAVGALLIYRYTNKESNQNQLAQHENFERTVNYLMAEENRAQNLPNWLRVYTNSARDNINEAFRIANENILSNSLLNKVVSMTWQISEPILILTLFVTPYLNGSMTFGHLAEILFKLNIIMGAIGGFISEAPFIGLIANFAENTSRVIRNYFLNKLPDVTTYRGLKATGELSQAVAPNTADGRLGDPKALTFCAEIERDATDKQKLSRQYGTQEKPLTVEPNTLVCVLGKNGAGKSVFLDALDPRLEFGISGDAGKGDNGFCLHCEQQIITLPPRVDRSKHNQLKDGSWTNQFMNFWQPNKNKAGKQSESDQQHSKPKPWTVTQIIAMLWPQDLQVDIETIDKDSVFELQRGAESDKPSKIKVTDLLSHVNEYMRRLDLPTNIDNMDFKDMSGGQMRKLRLAIYFAMAECIKPRLFMIDEPFNDVDDPSQRATCKMLKEFKEKNSGTTTFVVTHQDNNTLRLNLYDRVLLMRNSNKPIVYYGPVGEEWTGSGAAGYFKHIEENKIGCTVVPEHTCFDLP